MNTKLFRPRAVLSVTDRKKLQNEINLCRRDMGGGLGIPSPRGKEANSSPMPERMRNRLETYFYNAGAVDAGSVMRYRRASKTLAEGSPDSIGTAERNRLEKIVRDFEAWAPSRMATKRMNALKSRDDGFREAVQAALSEHSPEFIRRAEDYKNAMRQIDPDSPKAGDVERLRPN